eukprot:gnl/TRDRNA2_/TRDRNA2_27956_c0_seq1.p2 gnl/TRDRNA2_/TRDRNA2_27956_c0~~gnl/TRDRNA2_/TRDRNA2_27956_c0_seq1.p2  ORF type:complete len:118 (+),score=38.52 gnl/TRDRNA2_/TRDRNA2_27956_c0_seq1:404-757(+)
MYEFGKGGVEVNYEEAAKWYRKAAEQGNAGGQRGLGYMYELGRGGLQQSMQEAVIWYGKAAEQDDEWANKRIDSMEESISREYERKEKKKQEAKRKNMLNLVDTYKRQSKKKSQKNV